MASEEDLGRVLVHGPLAVADGGDVLDDDDVVRVLAGAVEDRVGGHHVVDHVGLGNLLGAELLRSAGKTDHEKREKRLDGDIGRRGRRT